MRNIKLLTIVALAALLGVISCAKEDVVSSETDENSTTRASENLVVSQSYDLNIIGVPQNYQGTWPNIANTIFVPLEGRPKLLVANADPGSYSILDDFAIDGSSKFVLPSSDIDVDGISSYGVWAKLEGVSGGIFNCNSTANNDGYYELCSSGTLTFRVGGNPRFVSASEQLLNVVVPRGKTINLEGSSGNVTLTSGKYPVFDNRFENHYWERYNDDGLRILKLRFVGK